MRFDLRFYNLDIQETLEFHMLALEKIHRSQQSCDFLRMSQEDFNHLSR